MCRLGVHILKKDIENIERVQHGATKLIGECAGLSYNDRLDREADYNKFFQLVDNSRTRGHRCKIVKVRSRLDIRNKFFSQRVVNSWNMLPTDVVEAEMVNSFKNRLDKLRAVTAASAVLV